MQGPWIAFHGQSSQPGGAGGAGGGKGKGGKGGGGGGKGGGGGEGEAPFQGQMAVVVPLYCLAAPGQEAEPIAYTRYTFGSSEEVRACVRTCVCVRV